MNGNSASLSGKEVPSSGKKGRDFATANFSNLERGSLIQILKHYSSLRSDAMEKSKEELVAIVEGVFKEAHVVTDEVLDNFAKRFCYSSADSSQARKRQRATREHLEAPARIGEQVAAKFTRVSDGTGWVLGNIMEYDAGSESYNVQDEDDVSRIMNLSKYDVKRLDESCVGLKRGDGVLAVYPETTSFYRATVARRGQHDVIVRFEDDEDENGILHPKRVPARFVLNMDLFEESDYDSN